MCRGNVGIANGVKTRQWQEEEEENKEEEETSEHHSSIKAAAGEQAEWRPVTIKNSTAVHQSQTVAGMKPEIWHTLAPIWLAVQMSL